MESGGVEWWRGGGVHNWLADWLSEHPLSLSLSLSALYIYIYIGFDLDCGMEIRDNKTNAWAGRWVRDCSGDANTICLSCQMLAAPFISMLKPWRSSFISTHPPKRPQWPARKTCRAYNYLPFSEYMAPDWQPKAMLTIWPIDNVTTHPPSHSNHPIKDDLGAGNILVLATLEATRERESQDCLFFFSLSKPYFSKIDKD